MNIGRRIKELRQKNNLTQEMLAEKLFVSYQTISKWETGTTNPDICQIVPIARLFGVSTDELFDFKESSEKLKQTELKKQYDETFKTGDISVRLSVCEEAVKAYPGDMKWLNNYAWSTWCNAITILDESELAVQRGKAISLFEKVIKNCEDIKIKADAIVGIVQCLNSLGKHEEARQYAELYPDTRISPNEKKMLCISCLTGEERIVMEQERTLNIADELISCLSTRKNITTIEQRNAAKAIIDILIPDGNYLTFHYHLYNIALSDARREIAAENLDDAIIFMKEARNHAIAFDSIQGKYAFTAPLFDQLKYDTTNWALTGTSTTLDDFKALFDLPAYSALKLHKEYFELIQ